jgi:hypothetical protein
MNLRAMKPCALIKGIDGSNIIYLWLGHFGCLKPPKAKHHNYLPILIKPYIAMWPVYIIRYIILVLAQCQTKSHNTRPRQTALHAYEVDVTGGISSAVDQSCRKTTAKSAHAEDREIYGDAHFLEKEAGHMRLLGHLVGPCCCLPIIYMLQTWLLLKPEPGIFFI